MGADGLLHGPAEAPPEVEAVGDLDRFRGAEPGALRVSPSPVPAEDLHARVRGEPVGQRSCLAAREHVDDLVRLTIGNHRRVPDTAAGGEIIDTEDPRGVVERVRHRPDAVQQPHSPRGQPQGSSHPGPDAARQGERDSVQELAEPVSAPRVRAAQPRYLLSECALGASRIDAHEASHGQ
ncbi:hypothetical protein ADL01_05650 [Streptomyces sp. NRRL WC-3618]|nr:hypothetical protein ADL01_05650 [Streptomyces sp. NRRL WC-3618]